MANSLRYQRSQRLAISGTIAVPTEAGTLLKISGDYAFAKAGVNDQVAGELVKTTTVNLKTEAVATNFNDVLTIKASAAITAGQQAKMAADDGSGVQQCAVWVDGTDSILRRIGTCIKGAALGADAEILTVV
jgi:hypothetical protein